jgi:hypothetical protein
MTFNDNISLLPESFTEFPSGLSTPIHWLKSMLSGTYRVSDMCNIYLHSVLHIGESLDTYRSFLHISNISDTRYVRISKSINYQDPDIQTDMLSNTYRVPDS